MNGGKNTIPRPERAGSRGAAIRAFLLVLVLVGCIPGPPCLRSETPATAIQMVGVTREGTNVSVHWRGGFPPYRLRFSRNLSSAWTEHPGFVKDTFFTTAADSEAQFFQVRTEFSPILLTGIRRDSEMVYLQWAGGAPPYRVQASTTPGAGWQDLPPLLLDNYYAGFATGNYSLYRVRSESDTNAPSIPGGLSSSSMHCQKAVLDWEAAEDVPPGSGIRAYNLYRDGLFVKQVESPAVFALDEGLSAGTSYQYSVSAVDSAGNESSRSPSVPVTTPACSDGGTNGSGADTALVIEWDRSEEPTTAGYIVHWGLQPGVYSWQMDVMKATTAAIEGLQPGTLYFFAVTAYDVNGAESEPSNKVTHIPP